MTRAPQPRLAQEGPARRTSIGARIRTWFLTGIVVTGPLAVTIMLVWWFVDFVDTAVRKMVPSRFWPDTYLPFALPGFGVVFAFLALTLLGFIAANLAGRTLLSFGERILDRTPVVRSIYRGAKQIFEALFSTSGTSLRRVGLVEFPMKGQWSIVFISSPPSPMVDASLPMSDDVRISVFLPCVPNPTTGFYFYLPARDVIEIPMTPEDAAKLIMSCGLIQPEGQAALAAMAEAARAEPAQAEANIAPPPERVPNYG